MVDWNAFDAKRLGVFQDRHAHDVYWGEEKRLAGDGLCDFDFGDHSPAGKNWKKY